ncbi:MAG: amidohydrolase, partial [Acidobacteriaceae bacterium]|nr:amidohydrolase [Acidobacteriaceae bacterium]
ARMTPAAHDVLLVNGNVLPMDGTTEPRAVAFHNGRIAYVGDSNTVRKGAAPGARVIDLAGRTVIPAFTDAHAHVWKMGHLLSTMLDVRRAASIDALVETVATRDKELPPEQWLLGRGFNEIAIAEKRKPARHDLDRAAPSRPVVLTRACGHIYAANSVALRRAAIDATTPAPPGGVIEYDEHGEPNGLLHETAMGLINRVMPQPSASDYELMIQAALRHQLSLGITASSDCGVTPELLDVYRDMDARGALPARVNVMPLRRVDGRRDPVPLPAQHVSDMLRVNTVKFVADGGLSGATAALSVPYRHANTTGTLRFEKQELLRLCQESQDKGWRIASHAIGDVAIDMVLSRYERLGPHPKRLAHRIEHFGLPSSEQLRRAARLGVIAVPQSIFLYELGGNFLEMLPESLFPRTYPIRAMLDAGLTVALSSDAPVVEDDNPLRGIYAAVTRRTNVGETILPEQAITAQEALYAYTMGGAIASGDECNRGSLTPGKWADVAVLSADPLAAEPEALAEIRVEMTFLAGNIAYER